MCPALLCFLTSRDHSLDSSAVDESSLNGLSSHVGPVDPVLESIVVHHGHVVDVRHREGDDVVVVRVVDVHSSDLYLSSVQQELPGLCRGEETLTRVHQEEKGIIER